MSQMHRFRLPIFLLFAAIFGVIIMQTQFCEETKCNGKKYKFIVIREYTLKQLSYCKYISSFISLAHTHTHTHIYKYIIIIIIIMVIFKCYFSGELIALS